jgi:hypothetical protein
MDVSALPGTLASPRRRYRTRFPIVALGVLSLLGALAGGLARLGWSVPVTAGLAAFHGPMMIAGFLGTVIGLERAVALGRVWAYAGPLATGLGSLMLAIALPGGAWMTTLGSVVMVMVFVQILWMQTAVFTVVMALGACSWLIGQMLWIAGSPIHHVVHWWAGFLILTIAGERLELTRMLPLGRSRRAAVVGIASVLLGGLVLTAATPDLGVRIAGTAMAGLAMWLGAFDVARRTVRGPRVARFIAVALLSGYVWLGVAGLLALRFGGVAAGGPYDAFVHALFVGFVFSMILGHAPIVLPAVLGVRVGYGPGFYLPLGLLHASLVLRLVGDCMPWLEGRRWGGLLNATAIVAFFAMIAQRIVASSRRVESSPPKPEGQAVAMAPPEGS